MLVYSMAAHYAPLHITRFHISTLCTCSYAYVLWQHTINHFILLFSVAAHCAPLQLYYIIWPHSAPLYYAAYCGNTVHHFILLYSMAAHYVPLHSAYPFAARYAPLHSAVFCDNTLCTTSYNSILWQITMHHFL
jgi:hypothetical protein